MPKVSQAGRVAPENGNEAIMGCLGIEFRIRVGRIPAERHVAPILGEEHSMSRLLLHVARPLQLPYRKIGVAMKAEEDARRGSRISNDKAHELLSVSGAVMHTP